MRELRKLSRLSKCIVAYMLHFKWTLFLSLYIVTHVCEYRCESWGKNLSLNVAAPKYIEFQKSLADYNVYEERILSFSSSSVLFINTKRKYHRHFAVISYNSKCHVRCTVHLNVNKSSDWINLFIIFSRALNTWAMSIITGRELLSKNKIKFNESYELSMIKTRTWYDQTIKQFLFFVFNLTENKIFADWSHFILLHVIVG